MFDSRDDPVYLLDCLETFLHLWHGPARAWYGISREKLDAVALPDPLRRLYSFAGHWPGLNSFGSAFCYQDCLADFEMLSRRDGRLVFAWENQACWSCGTSTEGRDPPVWVKFDGGEWQFLCDSLAQFLVTLCLRETLIGSRHANAVRGVASRLKEKGMHVSPLWMDGPYVGSAGGGPLERMTFHIAEKRLLIMDDRWCGTDDAERAKSLPELFPPPPEPPSEFRTEKPLWENPAIPLSIRKSQLVFAAARHQEQADFHAQKAANFRSLSEAFGD